MTRSINRIADLFNLPSTCRERILSPDHPGGWELSHAGLLGVGLSNLHRGYAIGALSRPYHVMLFSLSGVGQLSLPERTVLLNRGMGVFLPAGSAHVYRAHGKWTMIWLHYRIGAPALPRHPDKEVLIKCGGGQLESLVGTALERSLDSHSTAGNWMAHLVPLIAMESFRLLSIAPSAIGDHYRDHYRNLVTAVEGEVCRRWTNAEMSRLLHVSPPTLARIIAANGGGSPHQLVVSLRMRRAALLLTATDEPIYLVAGRVGYENAFAFSRAFKSAMGTSPQHYREERRGESPLGSQ